MTDAPRFLKLQRHDNPVFGARARAAATTASNGLARRFSRARTMGLCALLALTAMPASSTIMARESLAAQIQDGDLIYRVGTGWRAIAVASASGSLWTHVGVALWRNGRLYVVHAKPPEDAAAGFVQGEPFETFAGEGLSWKVVPVAYRSEQDRARAVAFAEGQAAQATPFYEAFDLDTPSALYCTELALRALGTLHPNITSVDGMLIKVALVTPADLLAAQTEHEAVMESLARRDGGRDSGT